MGLVLALVMSVSAAVFGDVQRAPAASAAETGSAFYSRYQAAITKATGLDDVMAFWSADLIKQFNAAPADQRVDLGAMKRIYRMISGVRVVKETAGSTGATLDLEGVNADGRKVTGSVYLLKENGAWKIFSPETWNQG